MNINTRPKQHAVAQFRDHASQGKDQGNHIAKRHLWDVVLVFAQYIHTHTSQAVTTSSQNLSLALLH